MTIQTLGEMRARMMVMKMNEKIFNLARARDNKH